MNHQGILHSMYLNQTWAWWVWHDTVFNRFPQITVELEQLQQALFIYTVWPNCTHKRHTQLTKLLLLLFSNYLFKLASLDNTGISVFIIRETKYNVLFNGSGYDPWHLRGEGDAAAVLNNSLRRLQFSHDHHQKRALKMNNYGKVL